MITNSTTKNKRPIRFRVSIFNRGSSVMVRDEIAEAFSLVDVRASYLARGYGPGDVYIQQMMWV